MKDLLGRIIKKKEGSSSMSPPRYSRLGCEEVNNDDDQRQEAQKRGYIPIMVGKCEEEEERFMVPLGWMKHPSIVDLLQLAANEFGYHQQGVIHIPCKPHQFRVVIEKISCR